MKIIYIYFFCRFVCDNCLKKKNAKRKDNKYNARRLPVTKLGTYIETRVNNFLKKKEAGAGEVTVRVVSSSEKTVEVKPGMKSRYVADLCFNRFHNLKIGSKFNFCIRIVF